MRVIVPYTRVAPETANALAAAGVTAELVDVSCDVTAYFDLLAGLWADGQDFALVEQDITIRRSTIESFERCGNDWCAAPYPYLGSGTYAGLGCARFRAKLIQATPDLFDDVALHDYPGHCLMHWCILDAAIQRELLKRHHHVCAAHKPVGHLHDMPTHGCVDLAA